MIVLGRTLTSVRTRSPRSPREPASCSASRPSRWGARGFGALLRWARRLDRDRVWALEDCRHVSGSLERFLIERGERVLRIPTHLTRMSRSPWNFVTAILWVNYLRRV